MNENSRTVLVGYIERMRTKLEQVNEKLVEYSYDENLKSRFEKQRANIEIRIGRAQALLAKHTAK